MSKLALILDALAPSVADAPDDPSKFEEQALIDNMAGGGALAAGTMKAAGQKTRKQKKQERKGKRRQANIKRSKQGNFRKNFSDMLKSSSNDFDEMIKKEMAKEAAEEGIEKGAKKASEKVAKEAAEEVAEKASRKSNLAKRLLKGAWGLAKAQPIPAAILGAAGIYGLKSLTGPEPYKKEEDIIMDKDDLEYEYVPVDVDNESQTEKSSDLDGLQKEIEAQNKYIEKELKKLIDM